MKKELESLMRRPANDEMVQGFTDGYNPDAPEPSANRSASYRHGFMVGRRDNDKSAPPCSAAGLERRADAAMNEDDVRAIQ
jgi:hypothetical protein